MATTTESFTSGAGQVLFPFTIQYIAQSDLKVAINGADTTAFTFANATTIQLNAAPATGSEVVIRRVTDVDNIDSQFFPGSSIRAQDLNDNFQQLLFSAQEDGGKVPLFNAVFPDDVSMGGNQINNLADPTAAQDAVTKQYLEDTTWNNTTETINSVEGWPSDDNTIATTGGIEARINAKIDTALTGDVAGSDGVTITDDGDGTITVGLAAGQVDFDRIKASDVITYAEQNAGAPAAADDNIFTASAAARRFDTLVQPGLPAGTDWEVGKTWLQTNQDLTLSIWNGATWSGVASGGTFTNQPKVVYVDASSGADTNDGHRISRPKKTIKAAIQQINGDATFGDGSVVVVAPGTYQEDCPIDIQKSNVSIVGTALRSCIVHPTVATEESVMFRVNSGTFLQNLTFTGMKASGALGNAADPALPVNQGWNIAFLPGCTIVKSPYIQNCTNFSDSEIDNSAIDVINPGGGLAGDIDSAPTGGGVLIDGSVPAIASPLRSIVCDSYTHVGLNGPGLLVTNNGYTQCTSSYAFFNKYHLKCLNGGQANLAASTTDFGDLALVADGKSTAPIFTSNVDGAVADGNLTFNVNEPVAGVGWFGDANRPGNNMLVVVNGITYPILSAVANVDSEGGNGWTVTISRPNPAKRSENLGVNGAVADNLPVEFFLRSMIASSGHTMEYVGSGTDYRALPENGGVPDDTKQKTELNGGKIWTATTDQNGAFTVGGNQTEDPIFKVDQQTGFVTIPSGSFSTNLLSDTTPQLGGDLDVQTHDITTTTANGNVKLLPKGTGVVEVKGANGNDGTLQLNCSQNSHGVKIKSPPHASAASYTLTLPDDDGNANDLLKSDGSGNLSWVASTATNISNTASNGLTSTNVQASLDELQVDVNTLNTNVASNATDISTNATSIGTKMPLAGGTFTGDVHLDNQQELRFEEATANGDNYVGFKSPATIADNVVWTLPATDGLAGQALVTDASGTLSWAAAGGASGAGTNLWALEHDNTITGSYSIGAGKNVVSAGPLTVNSGVTVTVPAGSNWVIV